MDFFEYADRITQSDLRRSGATKWATEDETIGAFVAEMDFGVAPAIRSALHQAVDEGAFGYMPQRLAAELREATAEMLALRHGWDVPATDVYPIADVIKALELAIEHHSAPESKIIVPTPTYMPFLLIPKAMNREVVEVPMIEDDRGYRLDLDGIGRAFEQGGNLLLLCNPHNPTGRVFSREELLQVSAVVDRHSGRVFADEIWHALTFPGQRYVPYASSSPAAAAHAITALSASKAWNLPGLKCAQVVTSNDGDREVWKRIGFLAAHGASNLGAVANAAAYRDGFPWLEQVRQYLDRSRSKLADLIGESFPRARYRPPEGTYVGWIDFRDVELPDAPAAFFRAHAGVALTEGASCGTGFDGFARFIFATPLRIMEAAFSRMKAAWPLGARGARGA